MMSKMFSYERCEQKVIKVEKPCDVCGDILFHYYRKMGDDKVFNFKLLKAHAYQDGQIKCWKCIRAGR
jgi:hypothetical protein